LEVNATESGPLQSKRISIGEGREKPEITNSSKPEDYFEHPVRTVRVLDTKFIFIMQVAQNESIALTFCEDSEDG
jgi:hypothetical protein